MWDLLVSATNSYAAQRQFAPHPRPWSNVTIEEMKSFIGMLIYMGIMRFSCIEVLAHNGCSSAEPWNVDIYGDYEV